MSQPDQNSMRVLLADDELAITYILRTKLESVGFEVTICESGSEALQSALADAPDIVVTDYQMPEMDGFAMAQALFENVKTTSIPVIMITARGHRITSEDLATTNIKHLIPKPFSAQEVLRLVCELLNQDGFTCSEARAA